MNNRLTASVEDYLETVFILSREKRVVRVKDIAEKMDVSMPSVNNALKCLKENGFVNHEKYGDIELTPSGRRRAAGIYDIHVALLSFFGDVLQIEGGAAEADACAIEHHISPVTLKKIIQFIEFVETPEVSGGLDLKARFAEFCRGEGRDESRR